MDDTIRPVAANKTAPTHWAKVWDIPTRLFHWILVLLVASAYVTARLGWIDWHFYVGYSILTLVAFRILWGFLGSDTSRFAGFVRGPAAAIAHLKHVARRQVEAEPGHNPAGAFMVLALLGLLLFQTVSGLFSNDGLFVEGPLAGLIAPDLSSRITGWHAFAFDLILIAVALHVAAILAYAVLLRQDLVRPMITGWRRLPAAAAAPQLAPAWRAGLLLLIAAAGVWTVVTFA